MEKLMDAILACQTSAAAQSLLQTLVAEACAQDKKADPAQLRNHVLGNIGYLSGYVDEKNADRILELFQTEHPFFGRSHPSDCEAFAWGRRYAQATASQAGQARVKSFFAQGDYAGLRRFLRLF